MQDWIFQRAKYPVFPQTVLRKFRYGGSLWGRGTGTEQKYHCVVITLPRTCLEIVLQIDKYRLCVQLEIFSQRIYTWIDGWTFILLFFSWFISFPSWCIRQKFVVVLSNHRILIILTTIVFSNANHIPLCTSQSVNIPDKEANKVDTMLSLKAKQKTCHTFDHRMIKHIVLFEAISLTWFWDDFEGFSSSLIFSCALKT